MKINYRTTEEIRKHAFALLKGISFDDLDEDFDLGDKCQSLTHGKKPIIENFINANDEFDFLVDEIKKLKDSGVALTDICVVARTKKLVDDYIALFTRAGIRSYAIKRNKVDDRSLDGFRVATMHRVMLMYGKEAEIKKYVNECCGGNGLEMAQRYFSLFRDYVLESKPAIIGHFDLVRYSNAALHLYDEDSSAYRIMALDALRVMFETNALLEVNTGGVARGYMSEPYPAAFLLKEWKAWGGEVIINSDCHDAKFLEAGYIQAEEILLSLGYEHVVRLSPNPEKEMWERVGLH